MSQAKVDRYKWEKRHRKQIMKREKRQLWIGRIIAVLILVGIVAWIIYSIVAYYQSIKATETKQFSINDTALTNYMNDLGSRLDEEDSEINSMLETEAESENIVETEADVENTVETEIESETIIETESEFEENMTEGETVS